MDNHCGGEVEGTRHVIRADPKRRLAVQVPEAHRNHVVEPVPGVLPGIFLCLGASAEEAPGKPHWRHDDLANWGKNPQHAPANAWGVLRLQVGNASSAAQTPDLTGEIEDSAAAHVRCWQVGYVYARGKHRLHAIT